MNWQQSFIVVFLPYEISTSKLIKKFHQLFLSANLWYLSLIVRTKHANDDHNNNNNNNNDNIARLVHWKLCCKYDMSRGEKWYEHQPEGVVENEKCKILWDMTIQCDHVIEARRPDVDVVVKEKNKAIIVDIASPWDHKVYEKGGEKIEKYQDLKREIGRLWGIRHLEVVPVVVGALGLVSNRLDAWLEKLGVTIRTGLLQKTALLGTARILRKLLES